MSRKQDGQEGRTWNGFQVGTTFELLGIDASHQRHMKSVPGNVEVHVYRSDVLPDHAVVGDRVVFVGMSKKRVPVPQPNTVVLRWEEIESPQFAMEDAPEAVEARKAYKPPTIKPEKSYRGNSLASGIPRGALRA